MKAKRFLPLFLVLAVVLTTLMLFGVVSYAAQEIYPKMTVDISKPIESGDSFTYKATVYLEDFGTLSGNGAVNDEAAKTVTDTGDYSGIKIKDWTLYMAFGDEDIAVSDGAAASGLEVIGSYIENGSDSVAASVAPTMITNYDESVKMLKVISSAGASVQTMYPYYGEATGKIILGTFEFITNTDSFTVELAGDIQLGETAQNGGFVDGITASTYATGNYANKAEGNKVLIMDVTESEPVVPDPPDEPEEPGLATQLGGSWSTLDGGKKRLYLVAGIDTLSYKSVGFVVTVNGKESEISTDTVFTSINVNWNGTPTTVTPKTFGAGNNYIFGQGFQYPETYVGTEIQLKAFAETLNGEKLYSKNITLGLK